MDFPRPGHLLSRAWASSSPYLALVDGSVLGSACEDTHGEEMAELSPGLEGDRESWAGKEQDLKRKKRKMVWRVCILERMCICLFI